MGKINVLDFEVANLIAAGEVVERPASVIKELLENSIDAGATIITAEIKSGGVIFMRVCDNGCGIAPEDMPIALKRHATSKIKNAKDLDEILTLGFRGEALAAISAVSKIRIMSKTDEAANGVMLCADCGKIESVSEIGCPVGTTVIVEELFANVPARRKFLKRDVTEAMAVSATVEKIAMSHPEISFRLIIDGTVKFETAGDGKLESAILSLLGRDFVKKTLKIMQNVDGVKVSGFIGTPDNVKGNRNFQNFFINNRYIKSRTAMAAIEQAYTSYIAPERFPACVLFIDINPSLVDVNVHPSKLEVKFSNEKIVFDAIYYAVRNALESNKSRSELELGARQTNNTPESNQRPMGKFSVNAFMPLVDRSEEKPFYHEQMKIRQGSALPLSSGRESFDRGEQGVLSRKIDFESKISEQSESVIKTDAIPSDKNGENVFPPQDLPEYRIIGTAFNCYIFVELENSIMVIDKHAAHERILFEELRHKLNDFSPAPQKLLLPISISLSSNEFAAVLEYRDDIVSSGFDFDCDEKNSAVKINQLPAGISAADAAFVFSSITDRLSANTGDASLTKDIIYEKSLYQVACKAAMKGGRRDSFDNVKFVVEKILSIPDITVCPHGRPVVMITTKHSLDRQFGRE